MPLQQPVQALELGNHSRVCAIGPGGSQGLLRYVARHTHPHRRSASGHSGKVILREPHMHPTPAAPVLSPLTGRSPSRRGRTAVRSRSPSLTHHDSRLAHQLKAANP